MADSSNLDLVLDHFGGPLGQNETIENRIAVIDRLLGSGRIWLKISGYYRLKTGEKEPTPFARLIEYLLKYHSHRLIWGSDWPHTPDRQDRQKFRNTPLPFQNIDIYGSMAFLLNYIEDQKVIDRIFIKNPETIYQFLKDPESGNCLYWVKPVLNSTRTKGIEFSNFRQQDTVSM